MTFSLRSRSWSSSLTHLLNNVRACYPNNFIKHRIYQYSNIDITKFFFTNGPSFLSGCIYQGKRCKKEVKASWRADRRTTTSERMQNNWYREGNLSFSYSHQKAFWTVKSNSNISTKISLNKVEWRQKFRILLIKMLFRRTLTGWQWQASLLWVVLI